MDLPLVMLAIAVVLTVYLIGGAVRNPCAVGLHQFDWPEHRSPYSLWEDFQVTCGRGCGARKVLRCHRDIHWEYKHPDPTDTDDDEDGA